MFHIKVPMDMYNYGRKQDREKFYEMAKETGVNGVLLIVYPFDYTEKEYAKFNDAADYFKSKGLKVSVWYPHSLGHGRYEGVSLQKSIDIDGNESGHAVCPLHEGFVSYYIDALVKFIEKTKEHCDELYFDDDYRINWICSRPYCFCEQHMRKYCEELGENIDRKTFKEKVFETPVNRYKDAYLKVNAQVLREFTLKIREAVDRVDPQYNLGLATGPSLWGVELINGAEIASLLKAKGKEEMIRLSGGPYWCMQTVPKAFDLNLGNVIDFTRRQAKYCKENFPQSRVLAEADSWPRVRYVTPASYLENFSLAVCADENFDGMFKYFFTCQNSLSFDSGYMESAKTNLALSEKVKKMFREKVSCGIHPYESMQRFRHEKIATDVAIDIEKNHINKGITSRFFNDLSIPTTFEKESLYAVFGENAEDFDLGLLKYGAVLDIDAAQILCRRGVDVGLCSCKAEPSGNYLETFNFSEDTLAAEWDEVYDIKLKAGGVAQGYVTDGKKRYISSYFYENKNGERFYVFAFSMKKEFFKTMVCRNPLRQKQVHNACLLAGGRPLKVISINQPYLYTMVKEGEGRTAIGLWNFSAEHIRNLELIIDRPCSVINTLQCSAEAAENKVIVKELYSNEFAAIEIG